MYLPDLETFYRQADEYTLVPVYRELRADLETPVSVFLKLGATAPCFLLESVEKGEQLGRYSFIGINPSLVLQASENEGVITQDGVVSRISLGPQPGGLSPLDLVQELLAKHRVATTPGLPRFTGGAVGYLSYDMVRFFEKLPPCREDELSLPDCVFQFTDILIIFDHVQSKIKVVANARRNDNVVTAYRDAVDKIEAVVSLLNKPSLVEPLSLTSLKGGRAISELRSNFTPAEFKDRVEAAKEYITAGDAFQIVLSQRLRRQTNAHPFAVYRTLRMLNPSPYMFYFDFGGFQLIGSSPEMLVKVEEGNAETRPIAGTRPRGSSEDDEAIIADLLADPKEQAEHVMLVDLGRNDLGRVCRHGSVKVPLFMGIEKYSHVIHIVSSVEGELIEGYNAFDLLRACFPAGTVTGAPKIRAMEIINELEGLRRGPYAGAVGYFSFNGNMDTCITIRTIVMAGDKVYLQGGAGIVADSDPEQEYQESLRKVEVLGKAVQIAEAEVRGVRT
jgi:anthranilate synthase component 1